MPYVHARRKRVENPKASACKIMCLYHLKVCLFMKLLNKKMCPLLLEFVIISLDDTKRKFFFYTNTFIEKIINISNN